MDKEKLKGVIEAILFASGRVVKIRELIALLELNSDEIISAIGELQKEYEKENRGLEIIRVEDGYQLASKSEYHEYIYPILDKRAKPNLSTAALETLSIIAYNQRATRPEIDAIRGVSSDATIYKLLEYNLIENVGKADLPGRPTMYSTTESFLKMFGLTSLDELPELPKYKLDENEQIIREDILPKKEESNEADVEKKEAPMPAREEAEVIK